MRILLFPMGMIVSLMAAEWIRNSAINIYHRWTWFHYGMMAFIGAYYICSSMVILFSRDASKGSEVLIRVGAEPKSSSRAAATEEE